MPKFLDVPSYYGDSGRELSLDLGYSTLPLQSSSNIQFHQNLCPYGRYRLSFVANNVSASIFLYLYSGGSTVNAYNIGGTINATKEEFGNIYFEWGEGLGNYGLNTSDSTLAVKFHATFYNMAPLSPSYFPSSGTSYRYYPGKITTIVWGATTAGGSFSEGEMHIYVSDQLTLNGKAWNTSTRALSFYAPVSSGTKGQVLVSGGNGVAPGWSDANPLYMHIFTCNVRKTNANPEYMRAVTFTFDHKNAGDATLSRFLYNNGFTSSSKLYPCFGGFKNIASDNLDSLNIITGVYATSTADNDCVVVAMNSASLSNTMDGRTFTLANNIEIE